MKPRTIALWATLAPLALLALPLIAVNLLHFLQPDDGLPPRKRRVLPFTVDPFEEGLAALDAEDLGAARDYWLEIDPDQPGYSRAQRFIGWELHARHRGAALAGVPYVNRALLDDPFDGNAWQDWSRTYAAAIGFDVGQAPRPRRLDGSERP